MGSPFSGSIRLIYRSCFMSGTTAVADAATAHDTVEALLLDLVRSEQTYVDDVLSLLCDHFAIPLLKRTSLESTRAVLRRASSNSNTSASNNHGNNNFELALSDPRVVVYLTVLPALSKFHHVFLEELKEVDDAKDSQPDNEQYKVFADLWFKMLRLFHMYKRFSKFHQQAKKILWSEDAEPIFAKLLEEIRIQDAIQSLKGNSSNQNVVAYVQILLGKVLQRVPHYAGSVKRFVALSRGKLDEDLLDELSCSFWSLSEDVANAAMEQHHLMELYNLEKSFPGQSVGLIKVCRRLIYTGTLSKVCRKSNKHYTFHLFTDMIMYSKQDKSTGYFLLHRKIPLTQCTVEDVPDTDAMSHVFKISSPAKSFVVFAATSVLKYTWISYIKKAIEANRKMNETPDEDAEESTAPVWDPDEAKDYCTGCTRKFSMTTRRHHCRNCGQIVCGKCSSKKRIIENISSTKPVRVCDSCFAKMDETASSLASSMATLSVSSFDKSLAARRSSPLEGSRSERDKMSMILEELLTSERSYVGHIRNLYEVFARPLLELSFENLKAKKIEVCIYDESVNSKAVIVDIPRAQLSGQALEFLSQIETIYHVNQVFYEDLEDRFFSEAEEGQFSDLFKRFSGLFRLYGKYAQNYNHASNIFSANSKIFQNYVKGCESHPAFNRQTLASLLIMPIQRLPRYELFLKEIKKKADPATKEVVDRALEEIVQVTSEINTNIN